MAASPGAGIEDRRDVVVRFKKGGTGQQGSAGSVPMPFFETANY
jgi:hypothetical protein